MFSKSVWVFLFVLLSVFVLTGVAKAKPGYTAAPVWQSYIGNTFPADFRIRFETSKNNASGAIYTPEINYATYKKAADFIKKHESFVPCTRPDPSGYPTIGYGHKLLSNETYGCITRKEAEELLLKDINSTIANFSGGYDQLIDGFKFLSNIDNSRNNLSTANKLRLPADHKTVFFNNASRKLKGLNQNQTIAMISFLFNLGPKIIHQNINGTLGKAIRNGDYKGIAEAMKLYDKSITASGKKIRLPGLTKRRKEEARKFISNPKICWLSTRINKGTSFATYRICYRWR